MDNYINDDIERTEFNKLCPNNVYNPSILKAQKRIIVVGDIHGDFDLAVKSLILSEVINDNFEWIGKDTIVVQVGDQIDSFRPGSKSNSNLNSDIAVLKLFTYLNEQAKSYGGAVYSLFGNHELMNVNGNFSYVAKNEQYNKRKIDYETGGEIAKFMGCTRHGIIIIGNIMFVHAGFVSETLKEYNITKENNKHYIKNINTLLRKWLLKITNYDNPIIKQLNNSLSASPFWVRTLGQLQSNLNKENEQCKKHLHPVLDVFQINKIIIGHTPQQNGQITHTCGDSVYRVDGAFSNAFSSFKNNKSTFKVLEIKNYGKIYNVIEASTNFYKTIFFYPNDFLKRFFPETFKKMVIN